MGEFQLPSAKTHTMLRPAGVGHTKSDIKAEAFWCEKSHPSNISLIEVLGRISNSGSTRCACGVNEIAPGSRLDVKVARKNSM
jgi:hypothetical protein